MVHESQKSAYALEEALFYWVMELPDEAFIAGERPSGFTRKDLLPVYCAVWTRKERYLKRAIGREAGQ